MNKKYIIDGYSFGNQAEYERAKKEKETIMYLSANTNMADGKAIYKIYKQAVEKKTFRTVFGWEYMKNLRKILIDSKFVAEDLLEPIPLVQSQKLPVNGKKRGEETELINAEKYKQAYEKARFGSIIKNFLIAILFIVIGVMTFITYKSQYSVFTYFTNYKEDMRNELIDEYEDWTDELEQREERIKEKEKELDDTNHK